MVGPRGPSGRNFQPTGSRIFLVILSHCTVRRHRDSSLNPPESEGTLSQGQWRYTLWKAWAPFSHKTSLPIKGGCEFAPVLDPRFLTVFIQLWSSGSLLIWYIKGQQVSLATVAKVDWGGKKVSCSNLDFMILEAEWGFSPLSHPHSILNASSWGTKASGGGWEVAQSQGGWIGAGGRRAPREGPNSLFLQRNRGISVAWLWLVCSCLFCWCYKIICELLLWTLVSSLYWNPWWI